MCVCLAAHAQLRRTRFNAALTRCLTDRLEWLMQSGQQCTCTRRLREHRDVWTAYCNPMQTLVIAHRGSLVLIAGLESAHGLGWCARMTLGVDLRNDRGNASVCMSLKIVSADSAIVCASTPYSCIPTLQQVGSMRCHHAVIHLRLDSSTPPRPWHLTFAGSRMSRHLRYFVPPLRLLLPQQPSLCPLCVFFLLALTWRLLLPFLLLRLFLVGFAFCRRLCGMG